MYCKQAPLAIDFIIIGAGVTGLATAFRLRQAGHGVTVIDKGTGPSQTGGAHLPPNLTKVLVEWGFGDQLKRYGLPIRASKFLSMDDGHTIGHLEWREDVLQETGADYLVMQYQDLGEILFKAAKDAGVNFELELTVTSVQSDPDQPRLTLSDGRTLAAHVIIGADGPRSIVRETINGPAEETLEGHTVYVASISRNQLKDDPELYELTAYHSDRREYLAWTGENRHALGLTTDEGKKFSVSVFVPEVDAEGHLEDDVTLDGVMVARDKLDIPCEPRLRRILDRIPTFLRKRMYHREFAEDWTDEYGRLLLMSEAAYPIWPFCIQSCSMQVEDAGVLTTLFTHLKTQEQVSHLAQAFQEIRQPRAQSIYSKETKAFDTVWVPPGPARDARDQALSMMMAEGHKGWDETKLRWQWDEICEVFGYHAREAAEDWWVMWGILRERSQMVTNGLDFNMSVEVQRHGSIGDTVIA
ncbi:FAD/NAD(P)-binding domain-containing protein [Paxillus ammoniavirescens]|nr:FAD/NAD(P)-binding domain-containing protein [Paxillus ammoniavirescens]